MNTRCIHTISCRRVLLLFAMLALGLGAGYQAAGAFATVESRDASSDCGAAAVPWPVLIGSGYEIPLAELECERAPSTGGGQWGVILAGSGYEGQLGVVAGDQPLSTAAD